MSVLRVGIIGAGGIATDVHIPNYLLCGNKVKIVAIADVVVERAKEVAKKYDIPHAFERSEEHTSELQSRGHLVCRLLLEKKKNCKGNSDLFYNEKKRTD